MKIHEVDSIMSSPDTVYIINNVQHMHYGNKLLSYYRGPGVYGYLQVILDPVTDTVIEVVAIRE